MANFLGNAFSLSMIPDNSSVSTQVVAPVDVPVDCVSCIGHADTARVLEGILSRPVPVNRVSIALSTTDILFVAQFTGSRLPEGATMLPEGAAIKFIRVSIA